MIEQLVTAFSTFAGFIIAIYALFISRRAVKSIPRFDDFVRQENGEWLIEERFGKVIDLFGSRMAHSLKQSIFQAQGVPAKLEKGLKGAIALDVAENKMPLMLMLSDFLGINARTYIKKNPDALMALAADPRVQKIMSGFMGNNSPGQSSEGRM